MSDILSPKGLAALGAAAVFAGAATLLVEDPAIARGRARFDRAFHLADGLGLPEMNGDSCRACHQDPSLGGAGALELNVSRFGHDNGGAGPFANLAGGQGLSKLFPPRTPGREECPPAADVFEQRQTPALFGGGLLDTIPDAAIAAHEDPNDLDQDGVFGVARRIDVNGTTEIGRFGWKAQIPHLVDFVRDAMAGELGITTPDDGRGFGVRTDPDAVADPELSLAEVEDMAVFLRALPPPARGGSTDPRVARGEQLFAVVGCAKCHVPALAGLTGPVRAYTNLLLHRVAPPGFRGMAEPGAPAGFYRTPPLWGIAHTAPYMHDGRAEDLRAAIQLHDGEAAAVRATFLGRPAGDQEALLLFLQDL